ncbi:hypothetical protein BDV27DRAFT_147466 [Aspergillus caelatus]|uniref:(S)-ureidoglycine aminohydrolase cupin domain-containing protein n=1 Tax=Aspergillus caelatus TaxID=61420 RepID=A0A5N6ZW77_9EURO|nr:uncharacterized protein BDV27DRAFT_147466 [Aspergillus caelatus]KAE8361864.1 hypothetical protein BDV27DRAFT_147466 [Aspergillus caelatus]
MTFFVRSRTDVFKIPNFGGMPHVFFADYLGAESDKATSPISGSWFRIEKGPEATPPRYDYDEIGVVIEGEITLKDATGHTETVRRGDTFMIPRGSTITFSSNTYGVAWKCGGRPMSRL